MQKKTRTEAGIIGQVSANDNAAVHHIKLTRKIDDIGKGGTQWVSPFIRRALLFASMASRMLA
ncbi:Uncharacterised protein [Yersinia pseudotuberculosis]|nr:Uncharacterised protein [Yersinia pseudotuberculosis]